MILIDQPTNMDNLKQPSLQEVIIGGEVFYKISNAHEMRPFFMSIVSDSNHWLFVSGNGGISAGRKNSGFALFPYYTDDKITESAENTGSKTIIQATIEGNTHTWEPFSCRSELLYRNQRNLYKNVYGNKVIFEEINEDLGLSFQYEWCSSNLYGFVRKAKLTNNSGIAVSVNLLDGLQNILPYGVGPDLQNASSNLADAYKRSELAAASGLGIFALSAIIVDKAEPSEALKANTVWSLGLTQPLYLLSNLQLQNFRRGMAVKQEEDVKGERGSYYTVSAFSLEAGMEKEWMMVANVNQNHASIVQLDHDIRNDKDLAQKVVNDIALGTQNLVQLVASADGLQSSADGLRDTRHFSNVLFNIMRGGIFDNHYDIEKWDFKNYLGKANMQVAQEVESILESLPEVFTLFELRQSVQLSGNLHFARLATEYLPLKFSRRHGDPSRPWNQFSINTSSETDGSKILDYQGNWRDIFQNWEALAYAYPEFMEGMICKFLNASTFDGYNPYRVTKDGFDWETIEPDNPWSYIGYWGDHQIIYLLKFLEFLDGFKPGRLQEWLHTDGFVYANVPYIIKPYADILRNPKDTIVYDHDGDVKIQQRKKGLGADGALRTDAQGNIFQVSFMEKILATVLAKLSNLVPDGGIWMNTQRPEWNDANNALVGNGLSMVTLYYLRRFLRFFEPILQSAAGSQVSVSEELHACFSQIAATFSAGKPKVAGMDNTLRKQITDALGTAASEYRTAIYRHGFSGKKHQLNPDEILTCFRDAIVFLEQAIKSNKRKDKLYHTYNLISYNENSAQVDYLSEMLEGQVGVLSSGFLTASESLALLDSLKQSALYRADQYSYILYPNKNLPRFLHKNNIPGTLEQKSALLQALLRDGNKFIAEKDINGQLHFNGNFRNAEDLKQALQALDKKYQLLVETDTPLMLQAFEEIFRHREFTGRSGTFFGYEGLGSIYWHMVSKLLLAVQETCLRAIWQNEDTAVVHSLVKHYYDINEGIGVHKPVALYGAFPTDPYSHTPMGKGAQQPGMTGQVKEDILCRIGELGLFIRNGRLFFDPVLLRAAEFEAPPREAGYVTPGNEHRTLPVGANSIFFTYCQVPVVYTIADAEQVEVHLRDGSVQTQATLSLPEALGKAIWERKGEVAHIRVSILASRLR